MAKFTISKIEHYHDWLNWFNTKIRKSAKHWSKENEQPEPDQNRAK
jgi:hypothetical protein